MPRGTQGFPRNPKGAQGIPRDPRGTQGKPGDHRRSNGIPGDLNNSYFQILEICRIPTNSRNPEIQEIVRIVEIPEILNFALEPRLGRL